MPPSSAIRTRPLNEGSAGEALQPQVLSFPHRSCQRLNEGSAGEALQPISLEETQHIAEPSMKASPGGAATRHVALIDELRRPSMKAAPGGAATINPSPGDDDTFNPQ